MAKVDWITWKTDPNEIINPNKEIEKISERISDSNNYMNDIICESINHEMKSGGLDHDSLNIVGVSPAYEKANDIVKITNNIKYLLSKLNTEIYTSIQSQKRIEKSQLIEAIEKKIEEEQKILETTNILKDKISLGSNVVDIQEVLNIISITEEKIKRLNERLERANAL